MPETQPRAARIDEAPILAALDAALFPRPWGAEVFSDLVERPNAWVDVVRVRGAIAGYCVGRRIGPEAEFDRVGVDPAHRRAGLGGDLLGAFVSRAWADGIERVHLEVGADNRAARALYERAGFRAVGLRRGYYPGRPGGPAIDAVLMSVGAPVSASEL